MKLIAIKTSVFRILKGFGTLLNLDKIWDAVAEVVFKLRSDLSMDEWNTAVNTFLYPETDDAPSKLDERVYRDKRLALFLFSYNPKIWLKIAGQNSAHLYTVDKIKEFSNYFKLFHELHDDTKTMRCLVKFDGDLLRYASERLKDDTVTVEIAVGSSNKALNYMSERLQRDGTFVGTLYVSNSGPQGSLCRQKQVFTSDSILSGTKKSLDFTITLLKSSKIVNYRQLYVENHSDNDIVAKLVLKNYPFCFRHLSDRLRSDKNHCLKAIKRHSENIGYIKNKELLHDVLYHLRIIKADPGAIFYMSDEMKSNPLIIFEAIRGKMLSSGYLLTSRPIRESIFEFFKRFSQRRILLILRGLDDNKRSSLLSMLIYKGSHYWIPTMSYEGCENPLLPFVLSCLDEKHLKSYSTTNEVIIQRIKDEILHRQIKTIKQTKHPNIKAQTPIQRSSRRTLPTT